MGKETRIGPPLQRALDAGRDGWTPDEAARVQLRGQQAGLGEATIDQLVATELGQDAARQFAQATQARTPLSRTQSSAESGVTEESERPVLMRVFSNDPTLPSVRRRIPRSAFTLDDGKPTGLVGQRVEVLTPDKIGIEPLFSPEVIEALGLDEGGGPFGSVVAQVLQMRQTTDNIAEPVLPDAEGNFLVDTTGEDIAQTTAFFGSYEALELAEAASEMEIPWGVNNKLGIIPYAYVTTRGKGLNASSFSRGAANIEFGTVGRIEGGGLVPHSGVANTPLLGALQAQLAQLEAAPSPDKEKIASTRGMLEKVETLVAETGISPTLIEMAKSREVVAHEAFHSILFALKPGLLGSPIGGAFHEAFGDLGGFLTALNHPDILERMLEETGGDLRKPNVASRVGEQIGAFLTQIRPEHKDPNALRDLANDFTLDTFAPLTTTASSWWDVWQGGDLEPIETSEDLGPHSLSRLISGSLYTVYVDMFEAHKQALGANAATGADARTRTRQAALSARDDLARLLMRSIPYLPETRPSLRDLSRALIKADREHFSGSNSERLERILTERGVLDVPAAELFESEPEGKLSPTIGEGPSILSSLLPSVWTSLGRKPTEPTSSWAVLSSTTTRDGYRTIRLLAPEQQRPASTAKSPEENLVRTTTPEPEQPNMDGLPQSVCPVCSVSASADDRVSPSRYRSIVVDPQGNIIDIHGPHNTHDPDAQNPKPAP